MCDRCRLCRDSDSKVKSLLFMRTDQLQILTKMMIMNRDDDDDECSTFHDMEYLPE